MSEETIENTELVDEVPQDIQRMVDEMFPCKKAELEPEDEYEGREARAVPPAALLTGLSGLWTYPVQGVEPVEELLDALAKDEAVAAYRDDFAELRSLLDEYRTPREEIVGATALQLNYTRLFIGSFKMYAPPYASYYMDGEHQIYGPTAVAVDEVYAQFGIEINESEHDMPDHIRFLLAFMALLADGYEKTGAKDLALAYEDFVAEFLDPWMGEFSENIHKYADYGFYKKLIDFTRAAI